MGDLQTDQGESLELLYVPSSEFRRLLTEPVAAVARARAFAALARVNTLYMIAGAWSGHIGTSFSSLDIMSWLFLNEIRDLDKGPDACDVFFSSKGHDAPALYSVLIGLGLLPEDMVHRLRRLGGLPGHPHVETPYVQANTGSLGMGISKAKGMAIANRLAGRPRRIFVLTGDGELQEGQFWESLGSAANSGLGEIVAIVDHNKVQSDTWVNDVSPLGDLESRLAAFGWHVSRCDGHDVAALERTFRALDALTDRPKFVIADTIKGRGVSFMEGPAMKKGELYAFHSGAPAEQHYVDGVNELLQTAERAFKEVGLEPPRIERRTRSPRREPRQTENLIAAYGDALVKEATLNPRVVVLDADLVKDCGLVPFAHQFPDRFVECGIAEQDMVSTACGMARRGALPIVHSFACFLSTRPNEQIYNQCSEGTKVIYVGSLAGLLPGGPGHSHQSVRDISALGAVPNLILAEPSSEDEVRALLGYLANVVRESSYLRLVSVKWPLPFAYPIQRAVRLGEGWVVREGQDAVAFAYGPWLLANACAAAEEIEQMSGARVRVVNLPWLNRVDHEWLRRVIGTCRSIVTLDNHYVHGGQGEMLSAAIAELALDPAAHVTRVGVTTLPECGTNDEVLAHHGLDVAGLVKSLRQAGTAGGMTVLFWDIDGTLLTTAKAGVFAWEDAVLELTGSSFELATVRIAGLTDYQIAVKTFEALGIVPDTERVASLVNRYGELLPSSLPRKRGHVLPNVREILEGLQGRDGICSYLLTGNTRAGATAKLTHYGLLQYFASGAFAEDAGDRSTIAVRALQLARQDGPAANEDLFVIGDTPHDIDCANAIGARAIAVATGGYSIEELEVSQPWRVVAELPSPSDFMSLVSRARGGARQILPA